jgi:radical SAM superfamily enzyme YgiQ (UPF0313 family)
MASDESGIFNIVMIKPSHYDDDGYPIQWLRSAVPSNTLACLNGIAEDCRTRKVLGEGVDIRIEIFDETNRRIQPDRIMRKIERTGGRALIALIGVQSNQYPRAVDIARAFRARGYPVCIGGFHVSGCISMLDGLHVTLRDAQELGISLFAGEVEDCRLDEVLIDAWQGKLKPLYNHMAELPDLTNQPIPLCPEEHVRRYLGAISSLDLGRGCPYQCSFCTIINVQGRKSRFRTPDDLERIIRENLAQNIRRFFITDDNFARNRNWEAFFDRLIKLREEEGLKISFTIQVDALCHKIDRFIDKAARAGVRRVFIGLENINPDSLMGAKKRQNKITDYRQMLQQWKRARVLTLAGYIIGFPNDTKETIRRDIEIIKHELPIDILEFFILTPLPGSEDHKVLYDNGVWMDSDMNKYDTCHAVTDHPLMSRDELQSTYRSAWEWYYTPEHMETVMRRAAACGVSAGKIMFTMLWFFFSIRYARVHPLDGGYFRLRFRKDRRPTMKRENPFVFYPRYLKEVIGNHFWMAYWLARMGLVRRRIRHDGQEVRNYTDLALTPPADREFAELALFAETRGGAEAVDKRLREVAARESAKSAAE